jgi:hypothetical protein
MIYSCSKFEFDRIHIIFSINLIIKIENGGKALLKD